MDWPELRRWLSGDLKELTGELATRAAFRIFPLISHELRMTWDSKESSAPRLLNMLRGLLTMRVLDDTGSGDLQPNLRTVVSRLRGLDAYDHVARCIRSACNLHTLANRNDRYEELRKSLQSAKDGTQNVRTYGRTPYPLDIWNEVEADTRALSSASVVLPPHAIRDRESIQGAWDELVDHLRFYSASWDPWIKWLEFRLFGETSGLTLNEWRQVERHISTLPEEVWAAPQFINQEIEAALDRVGERDPDSGEIEGQNPTAILFSFLGDGTIDLDRSPADPGLPGATDPLLLDVLRVASDILEAPADNSAVLLRERTQRYADGIVHLHQASGPPVLIVHGESLRLLRQCYERSDASFDLPPLTEQMRLKLDELVARHNVLVAMYPALAAIDSSVVRRAGDEIVSNEDLRSIVESARSQKILTHDAEGALVVVVNEVGESGNDRLHVERASESGKNLIRVVLRELWRYKRSIGAAAVGIPPALYAVGKWALANETVLLKYFQTRPGMHETLVAIFDWLRTLPLL